MTRRAKSLLTAYFFAMFGPLGGHRMYLGLWMTALVMLAGTVGGFVLLIVGIGTGDPIRISMHSLPLCGVVTWWVLDLLSMPGMVDRANGTGVHQKSYASLAAVNLDPSFTATVRAAGADHEKPKKTALPDDYVRPWKQAREEPEVLRYRSEE